MPQSVRRKLLAQSETVDLGYADVLYEPLQRINRIYFPTSGFISLTVMVDDAATLAVGLVGNEGVYGVSLAQSGNTPNTRAVVQGVGSALSIDRRAFVRVCTGSRSLRRLMGRYAGYQLDQRAQVAACTQFHQIEARLARWLLMSLDRTHTGECYLTHEVLGKMLGVRRVGITKAASELQSRHLICYSRGNIKLLDRVGLESASCSCYKADQRSYARIVESMKVASE